MKKRQSEFLNNKKVVVVSQTAGGQTLFPHTGQLQRLWNDINRDFRFPLPNKLQQADKRAKASVKFSRHAAAAAFCGLFNAARADGLVLHPLPDKDLVTQIAIAQQITSPGPGGSIHYFKFYGGETFFVEIRLNGKRIKITSHVLDRFRERFPGNAGTGLTNLIVILFAHPWMTAVINGSCVMVTPYEDTMFAFPFEETDSEFLLKTCLTVNEIHSFTPEPPQNVYHHHYEEQYSPPAVCRWDPTKELERCRGLWLNRIPMRPEAPPLKESVTWVHAALQLTDVAKQFEFDPGSRFVFFDDLAGPVAHGIKSPGAS